MRGQALPPRGAKIIAGTIAVIVVTILGTWLLGGFVGLSGGGAAALIVGVAASFAVGIGLMAIVFHSSRSGQDEAAHGATEHEFKDRR